MANTSLRPVNLLLANVYLIMVLQLALNWGDADCRTNSNNYQLAFIVIMIGRVAIDEIYNNEVVGKKAFVICTFVTTALLVVYGIIQSVVIADNPDAFYYDPKTKQGSEMCFQNRIIFVGEIVISFLTLIKDIYFLVLAKSNQQKIQSE